MYAQRAFAEAEGYKFPVLADFWPHGAVAKAYGVFENHVAVQLVAHSSLISRHLALAGSQWTWRCSQYR